MKIDNLQLTAFLTAITEGTFELAAKKLCITASAVSQRIKQLEEKLGQVLIKRTTPCYPTAVGEILLRYAKMVSLLEQELFSELKIEGSDTEKFSAVAVVVNADSLDSWFSDVFRMLSHEKIVLDIKTEDQDHALALLKKGEVMAAVSTSPVAVQACTVEYIGTMRYLAVASPAFITRYFPEGVSPQALEKAPVLMFNQKDNLQERFIQFFTQDAITPPTYFLPSTQSFNQATESGLAWGMIPEPICRGNIMSGKIAEIASGFWIDVPLYWHRWRIKSLPIEQLSACVQLAADLHLRKHI